MFLREDQQLVITTDDGSTVQLIDIMGSDAEISQAARTSYGKEKVPRTVDEDFVLLHYMRRHRHTSPFEMAEVKFLLEMPIATARQHVRHRTASMNEYSMRYTEAIDRMAEVTEWRGQSTSNKQGSMGVIDSWPVGWVFQRTQDENKWSKISDLERNEIIANSASLGVHPWVAAPTAWPHDWELWDLSGQAEGQPAVLVCSQLPEGLTPAAYLSLRESDVQATCLYTYQERLTFGVAKEQARNDLPLSNFTRLYWKCNLHNLMHYLGLRREGHAQLEIQQIADAMYKLVGPHFPISLGAWDEWSFRATSFGACEWAAVKLALAEHSVSVGDVLHSYSSAWKGRHGVDCTKRQLDELRAKLS